MTSFSELARDARRRALKRPAPGANRRRAQLRRRSCSAPTRGPIVVASDYVRAVPELIRAFLPPGRRYVTLGTDGFGRSDTRAALRRFFEVDAEAIAVAALRSLKLADHRQHRRGDAEDGSRSRRGRLSGGRIQRDRTDLGKTLDALIQ